ncbi:SapB/AmfS family lanthipeptide [Streptosporangium sp. NPDC023615]
MAFILDLQGRGVPAEKANGDYAPAGPSSLSPSLCVSGWTLVGC